MPVIIRSDETTTPRNDGFLVPPWYVEDSVNSLDMNVASLIWGFSIGLAVFCAFKALWQSIRTWHGSHRITLYVILIWGEWLSNVAMSALGWLNLRGVIPSRLGAGPPVCRGTRLLTLLPAASGSGLAS